MIDPTDPYAGITQCLVHQHGMDEDCEHCKSEFDAKNNVLGQLAVLAEDNAKKGARMPGEALLALRLDLIIETILHDRNRLHFETEFGRRVLAMQANMLKEAVRQKLHVAGGGRIPNLRVKD